MNDDAKRWLAYARVDLRAAEVLIEEEIYSQACFHCQQCVEKSLKSILAKQRKTIPRTHSIAALTTLLAGIWSFSSASELTIFATFYMPTRYSDAFPGALPDALSDKSDADNALTIARNVLTEVETFLGITVQNSPFDQGSYL